MPQSYSIALNPPADRGGLFRAFRDPVADQGNLDNVRPWSDEEQGVLVNLRSLEGDPGDRK